jgi:peptidoglycan hydrolase-like protein with peptidoglycan-binding domain
MENIDTPKKEDTSAVETTSAGSEQAAVEVNTTTEVQESVKAPAAATNQTKKRGVVPATPNAVIGTGDTDIVYLSKCIYKNMYARKSLTVHHLQRRLTELGYTVADSDKDGWYGELTKEAVAQAQKDLGIADTGIIDAGTFAAIFDGDHNVTVNLTD